MKSFTKIAFLVVLIALVFSFQGAYAQCAMCQATVESSIAGGDNTAKGLNNGIMYLLAAPYILIAAVGFLWYKKFRKKDNAVIDMQTNKFE